MKSLKNVLIFSYYWPPAGGVGVQRWLKLTKYLPEFGWNPIIVTVKNGSYPYIDLSLLHEVPGNIEVHKTKTFEPFEWYNLLLGKRGKHVPTAVLDSSTNKNFLQKLAAFIRANFFIPDARKGWVNFAIDTGEKIFRTKHIDAIVTTGPPHSTHLIGLYFKKKYPIKWLADFRDPWTHLFTNTYLPQINLVKKLDKKLEKRVLQAVDT